MTLAILRRITGQSMRFYGGLPSKAPTQASVDIQDTHWGRFRSTGSWAIRCCQNWDHQNMYRPWIPIFRVSQDVVRVVRVVLLSFEYRF